MGTRIPTHTATPLPPELKARAAGQIASRLCQSALIYRCVAALTFGSEDGGRKCLRNVGQILWEYTDERATPHITLISICQTSRRRFPEECVNCLNDIGLTTEELVLDSRQGHEMCSLQSFLGDCAVSAVQAHPLPSNDVYVLAARCCIPV